MTIKEYLAYTGMSLTEFSRRAGVNWRTMWNIANRGTTPRKSTAKKIYEASERRISMQSLLSGYLK